MTKREKILSAVVGSLGLVVLLFYTASRVSNAYELREKKQLELAQTIRKQQRTIRFGRAAERELKGYLEKSLPADFRIAETEYHNWLRRWAKQAGFAGIKIIPQNPQPHRELYWQTGVVLLGQGDLPQLVAFLHEFYSADYLHRIDRLSIKPITNLETLDLRITVHALSMSQAENERLEPRVADRLRYDTVQPYVEAIAHRNFFAPANKPPKFAGSSSQRGNPNRPLIFRPQVEDPDGNTLVYSLTGEVPDGARIDPKTGEFRWTPPELGNYEVQVRVTDAGLPPKSATQTIKIAVVEPPAPKVGFDPATQAVVTGVTEDSGARSVWITVRTEDKVLILKEGDRISVGTVVGVIKEIREQEAQIATDDGRDIIVGLGKSLVPNASSPISGL